MKHSALLLALVAVFGTSHAQSSVTLFGVIDAGLTFGHGDIADRTQLSTSNLNASRIGLRGTEDLGNGLSAGFWLEGGVNNDVGTGQSTNTSNSTAGSVASGGLTFNRRSTVSLTTSWGEIRLGRDYTPQYVNIGAFDPFNNNGVGAPQTLMGALNGAAPYGIAAGGSTGPLIRASNSIGYFLPGNLGGLYGQAMYYMGEQPSNAANSNDGDGFGLRVGYVAGPFEVAAAAGRTRYVLGDIRTTNVGGSYNFGVIKIMGDVVRDSMSTGLTGKGWMIAAVLPVGAHQVHSSYSTYRTATGETGASKLAVAYQHNLSKRTALYATAARLRNKGGSAQAVGGALVSANSSSWGVDLGVRHAF